MTISFGKYEKEYQEENCKQCRWTKECPQHNDEACVEEFIGWLSDRLDDKMGVTNETCDC